MDDPVETYSQFVIVTTAIIAGYLLGRIYYESKSTVPAGAPRPPLPNHSTWRAMQTRPDNRQAMELASALHHPFGTARGSWQTQWEDFVTS